MNIENLLQESLSNSKRIEWFSEEITNVSEQASLINAKIEDGMKRAAAPQNESLATSKMVSDKAFAKMQAMVDMAKVLIERASRLSVEIQNLYVKVKPHSIYYSLKMEWKAWRLEQLKDRIQILLRCCSVYECVSIMESMLKNIKELLKIPLA